MSKSFGYVVCCGLAIALPALGANFGDPLPGLTSAQQSLFTDGKTTFEKVDDPIADGLGPVFNEASCATCHVGPQGTAANNAIGGTTERLEFRFGKNVDGVFDPLASQGGSLMQDHAIGDASQYFAPFAVNPNVPGGVMPDACAALGPITYVPEVIPADANVTAGRRTTPLFGLGLPNALTDNDIIVQALIEQIFTPFTAGRVSFVTNPDTGAQSVGRFGWKAQVPTLHVFSGDAYLNEMGVTSPSFPVESAPQGNTEILACNPFPGLNDDGEDVNKFTNFMMFLGPPPRGTITASVNRGSQIFGNIGCADCHTPTWRTGNNPIQALANRTFHPYTDFLLHDMGSLGDGITQNLATGRLMRTAPLWGLRVQTALLHDGRANSADPTTRLIQAIEAHEASPEARISEFIFDNLIGSGDRTDVLNFLKSL